LSQDNDIFVRKFNIDRLDTLKRSELELAKWLLKREQPKRKFTFKKSKKGRLISNRLCAVCKKGPVSEKRRTWKGVQNQYVHSSCANKS